MRLPVRIFSFKALADGKRIITAHWLNDVLTDKTMIQPSNPLHFPTPFQDKIPECKNLVRIQYTKWPRNTPSENSSKSKSNTTTGKTVLKSNVARATRLGHKAVEKITRSITYGMDLALG
jgi:hypothetical protein